MDINLEIPKVKQLRKDIDGVIQRVKSLDDCREVSICITKLQEAVMWLGMDLKRIENINSCPNTKDSSKGTNINHNSNNLKF